VTNNRWFEVYITDGLDKYYEKSTIPLIYILTLKVRGGAPLDLGDRYIHPYLQSLTALTSRNSSSPQAPPSRPLPDCLKQST
jgi:hypothetical protein